MENTAINMPVLALRGLTIFPECVLSFDVEREISIRALERAMESGQQIFLVAQRELTAFTPGMEDLFHIGTVSAVRQILRISEALPGKASPAVADGALSPGQCGAHPGGKEPRERFPAGGSAAADLLPFQRLCLHRPSDE